VPDFGVDEDIKWSLKNIADSEKNLKTKWVPVQDENGVWLVPEANKNKSYSYSSLVQTDAEIKTESDPICPSSGCDYASTKGKKTHPMNYFVPNFGKDKNVKETWSSLDWAENSRKHQWKLPADWDKKKDKEFEDFRIPNFGLEEDIVATQGNIAKAEKSLKTAWKPEQDDNGVWIVPEAANNKSYYYGKTRAASLLQLDETESADKQSDPICSSANYPCGTTHKSAHPVDYKVPNFGMDHDIITTQKNVAD